MKIWQMAKRFALLMLVNLLVMITIGLIVSLLFRGLAGRMGGNQSPWRSRAGWPR
jgi:hypothetical protein